MTSRHQGSVTGTPVQDHGPDQGRDGVMPSVQSPQRSPPAEGISAVASSRSHGITHPSAWLRKSGSPAGILRPAWHLCDFRFSPAPPAAGGPARSPVHAIRPRPVPRSPEIGRTTRPAPASSKVTRVRFAIRELGPIIAMRTWSAAGSQAATATSSFALGPRARTHPPARAARPAPGARGPACPGQISRAAVVLHQRLDLLTRQPAGQDLGGRPEVHQSLHHPRHSVGDRASSNSSIRTRSGPDHRVRPVRRVLPAEIQPPARTRRAGPCTPCPGRARPPRRPSGSRRPRKSAT